MTTPRTAAGRALAAHTGPGSPELYRRTALAIEAEARADALGAETLARAIHDVYCYRNAPMHSSPDHSAGRILAAIDALRERSEYRCSVCGSDDRTEHNDEMHAAEMRERSGG